VLYRLVDAPSNMEGRPSSLRTIPR
jgi:hypothetical protein